ncbi:alkaline phosphatase PhoX [Telluribacter sp.]|uniref:alkaline phosphatase PhoX n=1 Tax=Telluribacter sp. TaxID=1978767 RepID=UPI002E14FA11|nr:alkaline phosphatase PhoX [Telluribacter sp.]
MTQLSPTTRRDFLKLSGSASLGFFGLMSFVTNPASAMERSAESAFGYGPLLPDPKGVLNLPKGFSYQIISRKGSTMSDGLLVPGAPDGMAAFKGAKGRTILIRNHEMNPNPAGGGPFGLNNELLSKVDRNKLYDYGKGVMPELGGTTTIIYNPATGKVEKEYLSLAGTTRNCAGGPSPWNTWITCEETTKKSGPDNSCEKDHGYTFEVPATDKVQLHAAVPIKAMGRFNHEAVAVDPRTSIVYLTEDTGDSLIYRYIPQVPGKLLKGGKLQALMIRGQKSVDTRNWASLTTPVFPVRELMEVEWVDIENVESPQDDLRYQGFDKGAARFARGEGMWFGNNEIFFACTSGGKNGKGQVYRYIPSKHEGQSQEKSAPGQLELYIEPNDEELVKSCDNLTVAPWGDVVLCEDHPHPFVVGVTPKGEFYRLAENVGFKSEFAGGVFSPTGETFFVNIQGAGLTVAITGPWKIA